VSGIVLWIVLATVKADTRRSDVQGDREGVGCPVPWQDALALPSCCVKLQHQGREFRVCWATGVAMSKIQ